MNLPVKEVIFGMLAALTLLPALLMVVARNILHGALYLILSLTGVAGLFAMLGADFLFVSQVLVYAGGVMVVMLFVILLSGSPKDWVVRQFNEWLLLGAVTGSVFLALLLSLFHQLPEPDWPLPEVGPTTADLGMVLLRDMVLPFEAIALFLLAALVGAILFTKKEEGSRR